jgi:hypothetical protein
LYYQGIFCILESFSHKNTNMKPHTQEYIIDKLNNFYKIYNYTYDEVNYVNSNIPIKINCNHHGHFKIIPYKLFKNNIPICPKCKKEHIGFNVSNLETFIIKSNIIHESKYTYEDSNYISNSTPLNITCKEHGLFSITPECHISANRGCPECSKNNIKLTSDIVLNKFKSVHGSKYIYPQFIYKNILQNINIICPEHGEFNQKISTHINGSGCSICNKGSNITQFIKTSKQIHGDKYNYVKSKYVNNITDITINCPQHGDFTLKASYHIQGYGCPKCSKEDQNKKYFLLFKERSPLIHNNKYDYSKSIYSGRFSKTDIICPKHGVFSQTIGDHLQGCGCPQCSSEIANYSSSYEYEIIDFIKENIKTELIHRYNENRKEIDIFIPQYNLGIEVNGCYWHSHLKKDKKYHKTKSDYYIDKNIKIFHIWEYQWVNPLKKKIIKSMILNKLNITSSKIFARKCTIKNIPSSEYKEFCMNNHIQGHSPTQIKIGLYYNDILVACMGFSKLRINLGNKTSENKYELVRYCTLLNHNILGGASKILKYFENNYNPQTLVSYADNDYSNGNLYKILNFENKGCTNISYVYYIPKEGIIKNRYVFRKSELIKKGYNKELTEFDITNSMGLYRLYNSGTYKFEKQYI